MVVQTFAAQGISFHNDAILQIPLGIGQQSQLNNFSEVQVVTYIVPPPPPENAAPPPPVQFPPLLSADHAAAAAAGCVHSAGRQAERHLVAAANITWHLSVIDAGIAARCPPQHAARTAASRSARHCGSKSTEWQPDRLRDGRVARS